MEQWKPIEGYEGLYEISNYGNVKSLSRYRQNRHSGYIMPEQMRKHQLDKDGYLIVSLWKDDKLKTHKIHRLVAIHFIPNPNNLQEINHKDENKTNPRADNLEWCTRKYNMNHGNCPTKIGNTISKICKHRKPVEKINKFTGQIIAIYESVKDAGVNNGYARETIRDVCMGKHGLKGNFTYRYKNE